MKLAIDGFIENINTFPKTLSKITLLQLQDFEESQLNLINKLEKSFTIFYKEVIHGIDKLLNNNSDKIELSNSKSLLICNRSINSLFDANKDSILICNIKEEFNALHNFIFFLENNFLDEEYLEEEIGKIKSEISLMKYELHY